MQSYVYSKFVQSAESMMQMIESTIDRVFTLVLQYSRCLSICRGYIPHLGGPPRTAGSALCGVAATESSTHRLEEDSYHLLDNTSPSLQRP